MGVITWDDAGERYYETGTSKGVLYDYNADADPDEGEHYYSNGVAWNGLISVNDNPEGGDANDLYADNIKYGTLRAAEKGGFTIEAYQSPEEFDKCDGSLQLINNVPGIKIRQQSRSKFGFCYRSEIGNDESTGPDAGYMLHLYYGCSASPSSKDYQSVNDSPDAITLSWDVEAEPVNVPGFKPSSVLEIDSRTLDSDKMTQLENALYGTLSDEPYMPTPAEIIKMFTPADPEGGGETGGGGAAG